ncbi:hypothetical protein ACIA8E_40115, partial [Streptomyces sp. NPDC051664]
MNSFVNAIVWSVTGQRVSDADAGRIRREVMDPHDDLMVLLDRLQREIAHAEARVRRSADGVWSDAYAGAMVTFSSQGGKTALEDLKKTSARLGEFARTAAYQLDYTNRAIVLMAAEFLVEWAWTFTLGPLLAPIEQAILRRVFALIFRYLLGRVAAILALHEITNAGLSGAMDLLTRWSLAREGKTTENGGAFFKEAVGSGAMTGLFSPLAPGVGNLLGKGLGKIQLDPRMLNKMTLQIREPNSLSPGRHTNDALVPLPTTANTSRLPLAPGTRVPRSAGAPRTDEHTIPATHAQQGRSLGHVVRERMEESAGESVTEVVGEGAYSLVTVGTFSTSIGTGLAGFVGTHLSMALHDNAQNLSAKLRNLSLTPAQLNPLPPTTSTSSTRSAVGTTPTNQPTDPSTQPPATTEPTPHTTTEITTTPPAYAEHSPAIGAI